MTLLDVVRCFFFFLCVCGFFCVFFTGGGGWGRFNKHPHFTIEDDAWKEGLLLVRVVTCRGSTLS